MSREEYYTNLEKALMDEINMILECYEDDENVKLSEEVKNAIANNIINYEDKIWEDLHIIICDYIREELLEEERKNK